MQIEIHADSGALAKAAAAQGAEAIRAAVAAKGSAVVVLATGASQIAMLAELTRADLDWTKVTVFHLDEYVGLGIDHPASFRRYLQERFVDQVAGLKAFVAVDGDADDIAAEVARLNRLLAGATVDVCFAGIGENCHLAFNDPPADFAAEDPYIVVELDEACRRQQLGEGWFPTLEDVPRRAVSMSVCQIMKAQTIVLSVPDERKAEAVAQAVETEVSPAFPASILQRHPATTLHLDPASASRLKPGAA
ncbi:glucosamine-6-phosphate deaminase [Aurantimonas sp. HBX-1]|uniref:glucosamine-6-phosphate deaminase n=1 Tax=Aurantimonas sp. HBX-1 TaxID=2906072 RepID=UPI001F2962A8|nr:glucosamine-6-phosphate deaminase [Aurantimonas sp. HBX-1]UIJ72126.1 glucosamine-6-phosphate deaminase [Aurantimonas sp. HBX-1]